MIKAFVPHLEARISNPTRLAVFAA